jgi:hypothetical protein
MDFHEKWIQGVHLNYVNMPTISPRDRESKISVGKDERRKEGIIKASIW